MKTMKTKHKLLSKAAAVFVTICMLFTLTPLNAFAFSADNYKAQIEKVSVGAPITRVGGGQYLPVTVYFSAAENLGDKYAVEFLEGYLKTTLGDGTTTDGIAGLGMTLMGPEKPDELEKAGSNHFSWEWSEGKGTGVLKYDIPLLNDGDTQSKSTTTGQVVVNGLKVDDKVAFQIETVFTSEVRPEKGSVMSDEFVITIEDSRNYPKTITQSSGEEKCKHDGELTYYAANKKQHNIFCEECQKEIGVEDHDFSIHKSVSMDSKTGRIYTTDDGVRVRGDVRGEADICSKCGEATNFKSAAIKPIDPTKKFSDVPAGKWYSKPDGPIAYVVANGIMKGTGNGSSFEPESPCTREMFVQILYNAEGASGAGPSNPFTDVKAGKWYYNAVTWALANNVTSGKSATEFGVGENVTREQLAQFLMNYATKRGFDTTKRADLSKFPDAGEISGWAKEAVSWANANGIINGKAKNGKNYLAPKGNGSRAEIAQMIMNFQNKFGR